MLVYLSLLEEDQDKSKFETLYLTYRQMMFRTANSILHDPQLAEDAVQQAFLRILGHMDKITSAECPQTKSFVVIIVRNIAINLYNSRRRHAVLSLDELEDWTPGDLSPAGAVEAQDDYERLAGLIASLPESYRGVLMLKYDNGYSTKEIAQMLELSEENVKKRIQRARTKLEQVMGGVKAP